MSTQSDLAELYTTFFNRAPDAGGLAYWVDNITTGKLTLTQVAKNWMTQQPEGLTSFPATLTNAQFVDKIYTNILGRTSDASGAQYWLTQLQSGAVTRDSFALSVVNGAKANTSAQGQLDTALINNKATVGVAFAAKGLNDTTLAAKVLTSVSANADTLASTLAVISLLPATTAAQTPAVLASATQVLTKLAALITTAPAEVADAATYLKALVAGVSGTTNIGTLLDNANTLLTSAATNPTALDNPAAQGAAAVVVATPSTGGGGGTAPATFTVTESGTHELIFSGTATGDITVAITGTDAVFTRGGIAAASVPLATVTKLQDATPLSLTVAQFNTLKAKIDVADTIKIVDTGAIIAGAVAALIADIALIDSIDANDATAITLTKVQLAAITSAKLTANDNIIVSDGTLSAAEIATLGIDTKVDTIRAATQSLTKVQYAAASAKLDAADTISVVDSSLTAAEIALLGVDSKVDIIRAATQVLTKAQYAAASAKLDATDTISVIDNSLTAAEIALLGADSKVDNIGAAAQALTKVQYAAASTKLNTVDVISVIDDSLTAAEIAILGADAKVDNIGAATQSLTAAQFIAAGAKLRSVDTVTIADTGAAIAAAIAAITAEATVVDVINASDFTAITLTKAQLATITSAKLTTDDNIIVNDSTLLAAEIATLGADTKIDAIRAATQSLDKTQYAAASAKLSTADSITVTDNTLDAAGIATLGADTKVDFIRAATQTLDATQFSAAVAKLNAADTINIVDTGTALATAIAALTTNVGKITTIDSNTNALSLTAAQAVVLGAKLTAADVVTITNTVGQGLQTIASGFQSTNDKLQFSDTDLVAATGFTTYGGGNAAVTFAGGVNKAELVVATGGALVASSATAAFLFDTATGKLSFDADGTGVTAAVDIVTLTGINTLAIGDFAFVA